MLARRPAHDRDVHLAERLLQQPLAAARRRRRQEELAPGQRVGIVGAAADANQLLDLVVVRRHVRVADRPGDLPAVFRGALEVEIGVAQAHAAPHVGLPAVPPDPNQLERLVGRREIRLLLRVEEELRRLLALRGALAPLPGLHVRPERAAIELGARVEHQHVDAFARQVPGGHAAGRAAANDDDGMDLARANDLHPASLQYRAGAARTEACLPSAGKIPG